MKSKTLTPILIAFMEEVWNTGDCSNLNQYLAPAYTIFDDPGDPWARQTIDHDTFRTRLAYSRDAFPDLHFEIKASLEDEQCVAIHWIMSGTHLGDLPDLVATGRPFAVSGMTFYHFKGDKICGHTQSFDQLGFLSQTGNLEQIFRNAMTSQT